MNGWTDLFWLPSASRRSILALLTGNSGARDAGRRGARNNGSRVGFDARIGFAGEAAIPTCPSLSRKLATLDRPGFESYAPRVTPERVLSPGRVRAARAIAIAADFLQIVVFPVFLPGAASIFDDALDVAVAGLMIVLVGWHWAFLPTFAAELIPFFDLVPTWTAAVFFATRSRKPGATPGVVETEVVSSQRIAESPAKSESGR
jgi:hypothetical protein